MVQVPSRTDDNIPIFVDSKMNQARARCHTPHRKYAFPGMSVLHIIEDDPQVRDLIKQVLTTGDRQIHTYEQGEDFLSRFPTVLIDVAILDYDLPGKNGLQLLRAIKEQFPEVEVIMMTGVGDEAIAHRAMEEGAYDYLNKPLDPSELRQVVEQALLSKQKGNSSDYLFDQQRNLIGFAGIIGRSTAMKHVFQTLQMLADSPTTPVIIRGETGTGKAAVARALHTTCHRQTDAFYKVTCNALQPEILQYELFGYEQTGFTNGSPANPGLIELANGGTLFLDEISDLDLALQMKLLDVLEDQSTRRIGGSEEYPVHLSMIASTTRSLEQMVREQKFWQKLYYRLNVISVDLPPLREREEDVLLLAEHFTILCNEQLGYDVSGFTDQAQNRLLEYAWPGNVSELRNVIEHAVLRKKSGTIDKHHLTLTPFQSGQSPASTAVNGEVAIPSEGIDFWAVEKRYVLTALNQAGENQAEAARLLGMSPKAYRSRLSKYTRSEDD